MTIVHISTDFPDPLQPDKTRAVQNLIDATADEFDHYTYSLNRADISPAVALGHSLSAAWPVQTGDEFEYGACWEYKAPAYGLYLKVVMRNLADKISEDIVRKDIRPTLVHGHKLSMEGVIAHRIAKNLGLPFGISIQGNSDRQILSVRRDLWPLYREVFHQAAIVFPFTPWALNYCEISLGKRAGPTLTLPCISSQERIITPKNTPPRLMSAFHLRHWKLKNLPILLNAFAEIDKGDDDLHLDIYGEGDEVVTMKLSKMIAASGAGRVHLAGGVAHDDIQQIMNNHAGFAMVSRRESFGMVFIEALLAGCPVVYPTNAAIDGYFDGHDFAIPASAKNQGAVTEAMAKLVFDQDRLKADLAKWQSGDEPERFQRAAIAKTFADGLRQGIKSKFVDEV